MAAEDAVADLAKRHFQDRTALRRRGLQGALAVKTATTPWSERSRCRQQSTFSLTVFTCGKIWLDPVGSQVLVSFLGFQRCYSLHPRSRLQPVPRPLRPSFCWFPDSEL